MLFFFICFFLHIQLVRRRLCAFNLHIFLKNSLKFLILSCLVIVDCIVVLLILNQCNFINKLTLIIVKYMLQYLDTFMSHKRRERKRRLSPTLSQEGTRGVFLILLDHQRRNPQSIVFERVVQYSLEHGHVYWAVCKDQQHQGIVHLVHMASV